jgi:uncharacterized repeat protein (TIGR02543 family)
VVINAPYDSTITIPSGEGFSRTGYTFSGWNTLPDGNGTEYRIGSTFRTTSNTFLYAQWELTPVSLPGTWRYEGAPGVFTITFANESTCSIEGQGVFQMFTGAHSYEYNNVSKNGNVYLTESQIPILFGISNYNTMWAEIPGSDALTLTKVQ